MVDYVIKTKVVTAATKEETAAKAAEKVAEMSLNEQIVIGTKAILAQAKAWATTPVGIITLIAVGIWGAVKAYDALTVSVEEHKQMLDDAKSSYTDTVSQIETLNTELSDTRSKISELEGYDTLSFTDQQELDKLRETNDELQRQIDLLNTQKRIEQDTVNNEFISTMEADLGKSSEYSSFEPVWNESNQLYEYVPIDEEQYIREQLDAYKSISEQIAEQEEIIHDNTLSKRDKKIAERTKKSLEKQLEDIKDYLQEKYKLLSSDAENVEYNDDTKKYLDFINAFQDKWTIAYSAVSGDAESWAQATDNAFNRVANKDEFTDIIDQIETLGDSADLTEQQYQPFIQALIDSGAISEDDENKYQKIIDKILGIGSAVESTATQISSQSLSAIYSDIKDKAESVTKAQDEMNKSGVVSLDTMMDLINSGLLTEDAFIKSANGYAISKSALDDLNDSVLSSYNLAINEAETAARAIVNSEAVKASAYKGTTNNILGQLIAQKVLLESRYTDLGIGGAGLSEFSYTLDDGTTISYDKTISAIQSLINAQNNLNKATDLYGVIKSSSNNSSSNSNNTKEYIADVDRLTNSEEKLANIRAQIEKLNTQKDMSSDYQEQIDYLNQIIVLYKSEQELLHLLNEERRNEIQNNITTLTAQGFNISYDAKNNELYIDNLEHINELSNDVREDTEKLIDSTYDLNNANKDSSSTWWDLAKSINTAYNSISDIGTDVLKEAQDSLNKLSDLMKDMIKQNYSDLIDSLKDEKDSLKEIIDLKKESLELTKSENDYTEKVSNLTSQIAELQAKYDTAKLDTSRSGKQNASDIAKQIADLQKQLADEQADYSTDTQEDALDKQYDDYEDAVDDKIDTYQDMLNDQTTMSQLAYNALEGMGADTYNNLLQYALEYTDTTESELLNMWNTATEAAKEYGSVANALSSVNSALEIANNSTGTSSIVQQMYNNSQAWHKASTQDEKDKLAAETFALGSSIGATRDENGVWWYNGQKLYDIFPVYHDGGVVGDNPNLKQDELLSVVQKGEIIFNKNQQDNLFKYLSTTPIANIKMPSQNLISSFNTISTSSNGGNIFNIDGSISVNDLSDDKLIKAIKNHARDIASIIAEQFKS